VIVPAEDVERGKPHPEGYARACELLEVAGADAVAIEDTEAGVASAKDAGLRCVAVLGTLARDRLLRADEIVEGVDVSLLERLLA
jgi:sugar-phosphatase